MGALSELRGDRQRETTDHRPRHPQLGVPILELDDSDPIALVGLTCATRITGVPWMTEPLGVTMNAVAVGLAPGGGPTTAETAAQIDPWLPVRSVGVNTAANE
jgi:hypothetical protein